MLFPSLGWRAATLFIVSISLLPLLFERRWLARTATDDVTVCSALEEMPTSIALALKERVAGSLYGLVIGDALAMPVHWYYNPRDIVRDFGKIVSFQAPKPKHPGSIMSLSNTGGAGRGVQTGSIIGDVINHGKKDLWGKSGIHYHHGMMAGENTLNALCARVLIKTITENSGKYSKTNWLESYIRFMTTPGSHNDTYAETYHRLFFLNWSRGTPIEMCAGDDGHNVETVGGLVGIPPVVLSSAHTSQRTAEDLAVKHQLTTHRSNNLSRYVRAYAGLLHQVVNGKDLKTATRETSKSMGFDVHRATEIYSRDTDAVSQLGPACYIQGAFNVIMYFAYKYSDSPEAALIANTNAGGENVHRGAALGALMGAAHGVQGFPERFRTDLADGSSIQEQVTAFAEAVSSLERKS